MSSTVYSGAERPFLAWLSQSNPNDRKFKHAMKVSELGGALRCSSLRSARKPCPDPSHVSAFTDAPMAELAGRAKREISAQEEREREAEQTAKGMNEEGAANLARLEEVRRRRAEAAAKREEEAAAAEAARRGSAPEPELDQSIEVDGASEKKNKKKSSKSKKGSKADRPQVPVPPPKEMKAALMRLQVRHPPN
eukprot:COSAG02_NODE_2068_length_9943_cov_5.977245_6_plen_194_part_00